MRVLFDTNVLLDWLLARPEFERDAGALIRSVAAFRVTGLISADTLTTLWYVVSKAATPVRAREALLETLRLFEVAPVDRIVLERALALPGFADFEDAVQHEAARAAGTHALITRNTADFAAATLEIYTPHEAVVKLRL